jgi:CheY-like chemotaxis protein
MEKAALTVIVPEDYKGLRYALTAHLRHAGFEVIEAINGLDALQKARDDSGSIDIPVTDLMMPRLEGKALAHALKADLPELRVR